MWEYVYAFIYIYIYMYLVIQYLIIWLQLLRYRHLMLNVVDLLPHCKKDNKVESKSSKGATLNELVELKSCSSCLFFEVNSFYSFWCPGHSIFVQMLGSLFSC